MGVLLASFLSTYASVRVLSTGGGFRMAYGAARPFFVEHGTFAAYLAFFLPPAIVESVAGDGRRRFLWGAGVAIILAGIVLTFTRAAWISVALVLPVLLVALGRARGGTARLLVPVSIVALVGLGIASTKLAEPLVGHVRTIVTTGNVSNLERLNRWTAAVEMTKARPLTGVGYGAYGEEYRTYRRKSIVTEQSLSMFGAHNELLRMLAETGWPGLVAAIWFLLAVAIAGVGTFARDPQSARGRLALGIVCGLATYAIHSLFNSYLGIDKISVPFWVFVGMLSALAATPRKTSEDLVKVA
jgi:putative inorganic carbon (HCO3(-)) transporter